MKKPNPLKITLNDWEILADDTEATAEYADGEFIQVKGNGLAHNIKLVLGKVWRCVEQQESERKEDS